MQSSGVRVIGRLGRLIGICRSQPVVQCGVRHLRASRSVGLTRANPTSQLLDLDSDDEGGWTTSAKASKLTEGSDWGNFEKPPRRPARELFPRRDGPDPLAPGPANDTSRDWQSTSSEPADLLLDNIRRSTGLDAILNLIERHEKVMNHHHLSRTVEQLFNQVVKKDPLSSPEMQDLLLDPRFTVLCVRLLRSYRYMSASAVLDVLKLLSIVGAPHDSRIVQTYLHMLKESVNDLSLNGLMYASFLLNKFSPNRLAEALTIAVPIAFELRMEKEMDPQDLNQMIRIASFCTSYHVGKATQRSAVQSLKSCFNKLKAKDAPPLHVLTNLFVRLERGNIVDMELNDIVLGLVAQGDLSTLRSGSIKKFLDSVRFLRAKYPADFAPDHQIFALEKRAVDFLAETDPQSLNGDTVFSDDTTAVEDVLSGRYKRDR